MSIALTKVETVQPAFEGWPLDVCSFNGEFDEAARERMISGGRLLLRYIQAYQEKLGDYILEIGPFFNPLVNRSFLEPQQRLTYWENDLYALRWLREHHMCNQVFPVACDIKDIAKVEFQFSSYPAFVESSNLAIYKGKYDAVIMSQILNYLNYKDFFSHIRRFIKPGGMVFINNVVNYGIPKFFAEQRPGSIVETIQTLEELDFEIIEKDLLPPPRPSDDDRLLLVAKFNGSPLLYP